MLCHLFSHQLDKAPPLSPTAAWLAGQIRTGPQFHLQSFGLAYKSLDTQACITTSKMIHGRLNTGQQRQRIHPGSLAACPHCGRSKETQDHAHRYAALKVSALSGLHRTCGLDQRSWQKEVAPLHGRFCTCISWSGYMEQKIQGSTFPSVKRGFRYSYTQQ